MKLDGGGLLGFVIALPSFSLMALSNVSLLRCYISKFSSYMLKGRIDLQGTIVALEVSTACNISLPLFLMGPRNFPRHYFAAGNEFLVI